MLYIIYAIHVVICLFLIMVVLLQQGSGADLSVFGGGGTQTAFGARSATSLLHKLTVGGFIGFILTTMAFGFLKSGGTSGSVMSGIEQSAPVETEAASADDAVAPEAAAAGEADAPPAEPVGTEDAADATGEPTAPEDTEQP